MAAFMEHGKGLTFSAMEAEYNVRARRPDYLTHMVPDWERRSAAFRDAARCRIDVAYGAHEDERLDFFPAQNSENRPCLIYFHGGYWQRGDKSVHTFLAEPFVKNGVSFISVNYSLCPSVRISRITQQARQAAAWVFLNSAQLNVAPDKIYVTGHSAGGHLVAMLMATDWLAFGRDLPQDLIKGGIPISGLYDLEPLRFTSINDGLRLTKEEVLAESPINHPPLTDALQLIACGACETSEFHRQSDLYARAVSRAGRPIERYSVPGCDHFTELNELATESSDFFGKALHLITSK